jgi:hypothetical protein
MSAIMYERAVDGATISLRIVTDSGDEIDYSSGRGLTMAIEDYPIFTEGQAEGAVVAMLSIDDFKDQQLDPGRLATRPERSGHDRAHHRLVERGAGRTAAEGGDAMSVHVPREVSPVGFYIPIWRWGAAVRARNGPTDRATRRPTETVWGRRHDADRGGRRYPCRPS